METYQYTEYYFPETTFEFLTELNQKPLKKEYTCNDYDDYIEQVEQPFIELCQLVSNQLPIELRSQFLGIYQGFPTSVLKQYFTIYPLLYITINQDGLAFGYEVKTYFSLFRQGQQKNRESFFHIISNMPDILIPQEGNEIITASTEVLQQSIDHLSKQIVRKFKKCLPLVLLASSDEPMPSIYQYLSSPNRKYLLIQCVEDTGINQAKLECWLQTIERKKQVILYGSPGTGKTFIAEKLAQHLIGGNDGFSELVQFHPAYSYEDFIQGIRPQNKDGQLTYSMAPGRFLEFCKKAESREGICVLIIDEINRANLAQVFGELMYLLEYRDKEIPLAGGNTFRIPSNVRIIGTMNTADRSLALVDHALRRRFAFIEIRPNYELLENYHKTRNPCFKVDRLIKVLKKLNQAIADKNYELGISFFLTEKLTEDIEDIWKMEIEPYLEEYFFDRLEKVDEFRWDKIKQQVLPEVLPDFDEAFPDSLIDKIEEDF